MGILSKFIRGFASIFTRKSIGEKVWARLFAGYGAYGLPGAWSADRRELALHYRGWSYIAVRVIAEEIAALQPQVGFVRSPQDYEERIGEVLKSCHPGRERQAEQAFRKRFRSKSAVRKSLAQLQEHEEIELVDNDHRLLRLLRNPNDWDTGYTFWFRTSMQLDIHGNFYWWVIPDGTGRPVEMWVLPSNWVWPSPNRDRDQIVSYYEVRPYGTPGAASSFVIPAEEIVHGMYPGPISMWDGFSPQTAMAPWIDVLESMDACQFAGFKNGVGFDATIELDPTMEDPEQATLKRLQERLKERSGEGHHKEPLVMAPGAKLTYPRGIAPYEMDYAASGDQKKDWVLAGWGVSKFMAGLSEDVNKASSRVAVANFFRKVIRPRLLLIDGYATECLARRVDEKLIVYHDDPTADDPEETRANITLAIQAKAITINEVRTDLLGKEPIEGGDVIIGTPTDTPLLGPDAAENADELGEILATLKEAQQPEQPGMPGMPGMNGNGRSETGPTNRLPQAERNGKALQTVGKGASHWHKTFNESDHPRDEGGKFGSGGGGAATPGEKPAKPENKLPGGTADREKEVANLTRAIAGPQKTTQARAKAGGEIGPNGEPYPGGAFIATTDMPKKARANIEKWSKGKVQVDGYAWEVPEPGRMAILDKLGGTAMDPKNGEVNYSYLEYQQQPPEYVAMIEEIAEKWKSGERWIDVNDYPSLANYKDVARLVVAGKPIPGVILSELPEEAKNNYAKYKPKSEQT